jgi:HK97 family phage prohead protease
MKRQAFRARVLDPAKMRVSEDGTKGEADILVAVFDIPDTAPAVGNEQRQVIDRGAFRSIIEDGTLAKRQFFLDHANAHITGYIDSRLKLGYSDNFRETDQGLVFTGHYNLDTQVGSEAFSNLRFDPDGTEFSFAWPADETIEDGEDGFQHVTKFTDVREVSQVGEGAQAATGALALRAAIASHSTGTDDGSWDGPAAKANLSNDAGASTLRRAFAWVDPEGDAETKAAYKFIHHNVDADGNVGAANVTGCRTGIGVLNGGRGGTTIPADDKQGVYNHLAKHIRDAGDEPPELRSAEQTTLDLNRASAQGVIAARAIAIDRVVMGIREAWWQGHAPQGGGPIDMSAGWVEEVYADDGELSAGYVIVGGETGDYRMVTWQATQDGYTFDEPGTAVEKSWTPSEAMAVARSRMFEAMRHSGTGHDLPPAPSKHMLTHWLKSDEFRDKLKDLLKDKEASTAMEAVIAEARAPDPRLGWYRRMFAERADSTEAAV